MKDPKYNARGRRLIVERWAQAHPGELDAITDPDEAFKVLRKTNPCLHGEWFGKQEHPCARCNTSIGIAYDYCVQCDEDRAAGGYPRTRPTEVSPSEVLDKKGIVVVKLDKTPESAKNLFDTMEGIFGKIE